MAATYGETPKQKKVSDKLRKLQEAHAVQDAKDRASKIDDPYRETFVTRVRHPQRRTCRA